MKRVLITGANSFVGTNIEQWLMKSPEDFQVDTVDTMNDAFSWSSILIFITIKISFENLQIFWCRQFDILVTSCRKEQANTKFNHHGIGIVGTIDANPFLKSLMIFLIQ